MACRMTKSSASAGFQSTFTCFLTISCISYVFRFKTYRRIQFDRMHVSVSMTLGRSLPPIESDISQLHPNRRAYHVLLYNYNRDRSRSIQESPHHLSNPHKIDEQVPDTIISPSSFALMIQFHIRYTLPDRLQY
jgi:hypothetical protein